MSSQLESDDAADLTIDDSTVAAGRRKPEKKHMPTSLFSYFTGKLPPEGSTVTDEETSCDPEERRCRTPIHVWEARCSSCTGTGTARSRATRSRGSRRSPYRSGCVCMMCHGLGYVRHSTTRWESVPYVNGNGPNTTIGRPPVQEKPQRSFPGSKGKQ
ncbi:hypothetical protein D9Q98_009008 [Chlorella vulgaris]|uniref:Uncharacterized protein n=1 Tax=Chlorella vulgaris TaxID=3077 RepID=A0A9D4TH36_CHLVU|nr:hypothetical protein D9Q98_009008 [Chlorella vulgaris]